jgi:hypothetical protein
MATRMQQRRGTASQWTTADPILAAGELGFESDTGQFKIGDGVNHWSDLSYFINEAELGGSLDGLATEAYVDSAVSALVDGAPNLLNTLNELSAAIGDDADFLSRVVSIVKKTTTQWNADTTPIAAGAIAYDTTTSYFKVGNGTDTWSNLSHMWNGSQVSTYIGQQIDNLLNNDVQFFGTVTLAADTVLAGEVLATQISDIESSVSTIGTSVDGIQTDVTALQTGLSNAETALEDLDTEVTNLSTSLSGDITTLQDDLNTAEATLATAVSDLDTHESATTNVHGIADTAALATKSYADSAVTNAVVALTKSSVGLGNVDNTSDANKPVSTATQSALDLKANLANPTFTGTVAGITKSMVGLGNVDNTTDANKPVSTATQTALDTKLNLSGGTLTGALTLSGAPTSDLHAATKQYVDGIAAGINFHQPVVAATTGNLAGTYNNGTDGVGATITAASNGAIGTIDGASVSVGSRILLRAQTDNKQNGVYTVTAVGSVSAPWVVTRATDADNNPSGELANGDFTFVTSGSTNGSKGFILNTTGSITIGTTGITYAQFNASEAVIAGAGITKTGETISIGTGAITSSMILDGTIADADINASAAIAQSKIANLVSDLAAKAPLNSPTFTGTVTLPTGAVTSTMILDGTILDADINASAAIAQSKISGLSTSLDAKADKTATINTMSGSHTVVLADVNNIREMSNGGTFTIPSDNAFWPIGQRVEVVQTGSTQVTIAGAAGVTVNGTPGLKLRTQWSGATVIKRAANTFVVLGDLAV